MKAVVFGYGGFGRAGLAAVLRAGITVDLVVTHADHPAEICWWESMADLAREHGIPLLLDADVHAVTTRERLAALHPDALFSFYFRHLIPPAILELAPRGAFNLHGSLLPLFRGRAPINWQLVHGARASGLTLHRMVARADAGCIVAQEPCAIDPDDDAYALTCRMLDLAPGFLARALAGIIAGTSLEREQDLAQGSVYGRRTSEDGRIDWSWPARRIHDLVRAVAPPWPGAFSEHDGQRIIIARTRVAHDDGTFGHPGSVLPGGRIACGSGALHILSAYRAAGGCLPVLHPGFTL